MSGGLVLGTSLFNRSAKFHKTWTLKSGKEKLWKAIIRHKKQHNYGEQLSSKGNITSRTRSGAQPEIFQGSGGFAKLGHFDKYFVKNSRKKEPRMENFGVFSPRYS